mmetsp:Transcript_6059/g.6971  ORF Transcript_6059/g.6971 Transcript_6059/m.6971 type:complete len:81 (-) Transcript_6059:491-733(-)
MVTIRLKSHGKLAEETCYFCGKVESIVCEANKVGCCNTSCRRDTIFQQVSQLAASPQWGESKSVAMKSMNGERNWFSIDN